MLLLILSTPSTLQFSIFFETTPFDAYFIKQKESFKRNNKLGNTLITKANTHMHPPDNTGYYMIELNLRTPRDCAHRPDRRMPSCLYPAIRRSSATRRMSTASSLVVRVLPSKVLAFLCFQSIQPIKNTMESNPRLKCLSTRFLLDSHHSMNGCGRTSTLGK